MKQNSFSFGEFGDCELKTMSFDLGSVYVKLFSSEKFEFYSLNILDIIYFIFETSHTQIVVDEIFIFDNFIDAKMNCQFVDFINKKSLNDELTKTVGNYKIFYIQSILGGDCVAVCSSVEVD